MTKRQARLFFIVCTLGFTIIFLGLTVHSHTRFGELTNEDNMTPQVLAGKDVWHEGNCVNCHTLFGEGAYFAPDLTKITDHRGDQYLKAFMQDPARFYSDEKHRRVMPNPDLTDQEIEDVIAFLKWIAAVDNQGWPPRPILVAGGTFPGTATTPDSPGPPAEPGKTADAAAGEELYRQSPPACFTCHSTAPNVNLAGPSLAGMATRAEETLASADYTGAAETPEAYIREAIVDPSAHLVPGDIYSAGGRSFMPDNYSDQLTEEQIDLLVAYLMTLR